MKELVEFIVKQLISHPEVMTCDVKDNVIFISLDKSDMGKVIGKQGKIIKAIRTLVRALTSKDEPKLSVEVTEIVED